MVADDFPNIAHPGHPVIRAIRGRMRAGGRRPAGESPSSKLGLVVEGGGMRGVISGGALLAMDALGLAEAFDEVYAESAGAINGSYFLAGQAVLGSRIYFEDIANARFINPLRVRRILDLDFLVDADPIPVRNAVANGCTHILVLLTRPPAYRDRGFRGPLWLAARLPLGKKWNTGLVHALLREKCNRYNAARDLAFGSARPERPASIAVICPDGHSHGVARLTRDSVRLRAALMASREQAVELFRGAG